MPAAPISVVALEEGLLVAAPMMFGLLFRVDNSLGGDVYVDDTKVDL